MRRPLPKFRQRQLRDSKFKPYTMDRPEEGGFDARLKNVARMFGLCSECGEIEERHPKSNCEKFISIV